MENSRSDFSCIIAIVGRCVDTGLKLIEDAIYQVYKKSSLKYSFEPIPLPNLRNVFISVFYLAEPGEMEDHALSIRHITPDNEQDIKHYRFTWSEIIWGKTSCIQNVTQKGKTIYCFDLYVFLFPIHTTWCSQTNLPFCLLTYFA